MKINTKTLGLLSLVGHFAFFAILVFEHFLRIELNPLSHFLSEYSLGKYGWIHISAFVILAFTQVCFFVGLVMNIRTSLFTEILFALYILGIVLLVVFPTDAPGSTPTTTGMIHGYSALITFASFLIALFGWWRDFSKEKDWKETGKITIWFALAAITIFVSSFFTPVSLAGFFQRFLLLCNLFWLLIISYKLYKFEK